MDTPGSLIVLFFFTTKFSTIIFIEGGWAIFSGEKWYNFLKSW